MTIVPDRRLAPPLILLAILAGCSAGGDDRDPAAPVASAAEVEAASLEGDPAAGRAIFGRCAMCHSIEPGENRLGPTLHGVVGRDIGSVPGFAYSPANRAAEGEWTRERLLAFIEAPRRAMPGTRMAFAGLPDPQARADLIAYLETLS